MCPPPSLSPPPPSSPPVVVADVAVVVVVVLPSFSLPELLELTSGLFGPFHTGMDAVMPLRLATMLRRRRLARIVPLGWMDAGGGGRSGGDGRVTSGRQARSAESVAPIPDMVDDRKA
jgi:hypothetical protein